jgi:hypothetical protein
MKNKILGVMFLLANLILVPCAYAVCPLCTFAVGAGIGIAEWLGIDDAVSGLWLGGLAVSLIIWTTSWLSQRGIKFFGRKILIIVVYYILIIAPLYWYGFIGHTLNKLWGVDKLILGVVVGSVAFASGVVAHEIAKRHHGGKSYFPCQKIVLCIAPLLIGSVIFYFLTK